MTGAVLVVDDSTTVRMDLIDAFRGEGMQVVGADCLASARTLLATEEIGAAVLDLRLPDGSGIDLVREIRALPGKDRIPIMMLSTEAEVRDRIRGLALGVDEYAGKPYDRDYVIARVRELLAKGSTTSAGAQQRVLVIDDSVTVREELREGLERRGYAVLVASSGEEGLRMAALHRPAAIVVDGTLPGMDGATVIRKLRLDAALRHTGCVLLTGSSADRSAELHALDAGADAFVRKGDDMDVILARVTAVLRTGTTADDRSTASLLSAKRILAVDNSAAYLGALGAMLGGEGYDVIPARSADDALEMLGAQSVDCILLDESLGGMGAVATCRRIKESTAARDIPLIMLAAADDRTAMIDGLAAGADDYVIKSSDEVVLKARLRAQLRRKQIEDEARHIRVQLLSKELEATEARAARVLAETRAMLAGELERKNRELEAANAELESFSYTVSHDLRAPLRSISGFSGILLEDYADRLDDDAKGYLTRMQQATTRMNELIDDLLSLAQITRHGFERSDADMSALAHRVAQRLAARDPERHVAFVIEEGLRAAGDSRLIEIVLENLFGNAWKFSGRSAEPRIEFGRATQDGTAAFFVRDNGAGFDMERATRLFGVFQRLHSSADFEGTGIGLATVHRIITRHGGRVWATAAEGKGATFFFTLAPETAEAQRDLRSPR